MPRSVAQRVELFAGVLSIALCIGVIGWGLATNVRDSSPPSISQEPGPEIVLDDIIGKSGIRDWTFAKIGYRALLIIASIGVAGGALLHVQRQQAGSAATIWLGACILLVGSIATFRTIGGSLLASAPAAFVSALAGNIATGPTGVTAAITSKR